MDSLSTAQVWLLAGILLLTLEIVTPAFFAAALAVGCLIASLVSYLGARVEISWIVFSVVSLISIVYIRPLAKKMYKGKPLKTNAEAMIGKIAIAESDMNSTYSKGYVLLDGVSWKAVLDESSMPVYKGEQVKVVGMDSIVLRVKKLR
ncbi:MAG: NfeD family protein [Thermaurantimonas sp.]